MSENVLDLQETSGDTIKVSAAEYAEIVNQISEEAKSGPGSQLSRLISVRQKASMYLLSNPLEMTRLAETNSSLLEQISIDKKRARGENVLDSDDKISLVLKEVLERNKSEEVEELKVNLEKDPVLRYHLLNNANRDLIANNGSPALIDMVHQMQVETANEINEDPLKVIELGKKYKNHRSDFLHDLDRGELDDFQSDQDCSVHVKKYLDFDRLSKKIMLESAYGGFDIPLRKQREESSDVVSTNPLSLFMLGEKSRESDGDIIGRFGSDLDSFYGPHHWSENKLKGYDKFVEGIKSELGDSFDDPVVRFIKTEDKIKDIEMTGKDARELVYLKSLSKQSASEIKDDPEMIGELISNRSNLKGVFLSNVSDMKSSNVSKEDDNIIDLRPSSKLLRLTDESGVSSKEKNESFKKNDLQEIEEDDPILADAAIPSPSAQKNNETELENQGGFKRYTNGVYSAHKLEKDEGSINKDIIDNMPTSPRDVVKHFESSDSKFLALPLTNFSSSGAIDRALKNIAKKDPEELKRLYQNTINAKVAIEKSDEYSYGNENSKISHDRLEMGRRAMGVALVKYKVLSPAEVAKDASPLTSKSAMALQEDFRRDPKGYIQSGDTEGRIGFLTKIRDGISKDIQKGKRAADAFNKGFKQIMSGMDDFVLG